MKLFLQRIAFSSPPGRFPRRRKFLRLLPLCLLLCSSPLASQTGRRPFADPDSTHRPERARTYDLQHILLRLTLDEKAKSVSGTSTLTLQPLHPGLQIIEVDSGQLEIQSATLPDGTELPFDQTGESLRLHLPEPVSPTDILTLRIAFEARPRKGLYFIPSDPAHPDLAVQIWTQGQVADSHFWFPVYDAPNDKTTSEGFYTVRGDFTVISNGRLIGVQDDPVADTKTFHWKQEIPHSTYLISVVAGKFEKYSEEAGPVPLEYYVPPRTGREKALRTFGETPQMLRFFSERIGLPYPFAGYSQTAVRDFPLGGMENISATTLTDRTLHEEVSEPQASSTNLIAHELAHQWFGNLLTGADWAHTWLHEGFATFWAAAYREHRLGQDEYFYSLHQARTRYLREDRERYRRPLVTPVYTDPTDLFDQTGYNKGALVLDMLRHLLGEEHFFDALRHYVHKHQQQTVVTEDFQKAVEEATGENLGWFFQQWVYKAGYPELEVSQRWEASQQRLVLTLEQKQTVDSTTPLFRIPLDVEFTTPAGKKTFRIELAEARQEFPFSLDSAPVMVRLDPNHRILMTVNFPKSIPELLYQLENDPAAPGRIWTSEQLGKMGDKPGVVRALRTRLVADRFWGVKEAAAAALGQIRTKAARAALADGLQDQDARVRQALVRALGSFLKEGQGAKLAERIYRTDANPVVAAEAALAIGRINASGAREFLEEAVERESDGDIIRRYALAGLRDLGNEKGWEIAARWVQSGHPSQTRIAAVETLARLGRGDQRTANQLMALLDDPDLLVKRRAILALAEGNFQGARTALWRSARQEDHPRTRRAAQRALERLASRSSDKVSNSPALAPASPPPLSPTPPPNSAESSRAPAH